MQLNKLIGHFQRLKASVSATTANAQVSSVPARSCSFSYLHLSSLASFSSASGHFLLSSYNMRFILDFRQMPSWVTDLRLPVNHHLYLSGHDGA